MSNNLPIMISDDAKDFSKCFFWLMRRTEISQQDKIVYSRLRNISKKCGVYEVSQAYLAHECGCSVKSVKRSIKKLVEVKLISTIRNGKKMYNHYNCHVHPWMEEDVKFNESEGTNTDFTTEITASEGTNTDLVKSDPVPSIYKEQNKKQINICNSSKKQINAKLNVQIKEIYEYWKIETKQPGLGLTKTRKSKIKSALEFGVKYDGYDEPLSIEQIKELISLHSKDKWWVDNNRMDLSSILTQQRMTDYVDGRLKKNSANGTTNTFIEI